MLKLQTRDSVVKMTQYSANHHSAQTTIKSIFFKQNIEMQKFGKSGLVLAKET
jgi:hypothetical protein